MGGFEKQSKDHLTGLTDEGGSSLIEIGRTGRGMSTKLHAVADASGRLTSFS
jgi:hypothetical protein